MKPLNSVDLTTFSQAINDDYGLKLEGKELHYAAWTLLQFIEVLIKFDLEDKNNKNGQKVLKLS